MAGGAGHSGWGGELEQTEKAKPKKLLWIIVGAVAAVLLAAAGVASYWLYSASGTLSLDVNPSVEMRTNRMGKVVELKALDEAATALLAGYEMTDKTPAFVLGEVLDLIIQGGYIGEEEDSHLLLTAGGSLAEERIAEAVDTVVSYVDYYELDPWLWYQKPEMDSDLMSQAGTAGMTAGRMVLVNKLDGAGTLARADLVKMTVGELVNYAEVSGVDLGLLDLYEVYFESAWGSDGSFDISFGDWVWEDGSDGTGEDDSGWWYDDSDWEWEDDSDWVWEDDSDWEWEDDSWTDDDDWTDAEYDDGDESWDEWGDEETGGGGEAA